MSQPAQRVRHSQTQLTGAPKHICWAQAPPHTTTTNQSSCSFLQPAQRLGKADAPVSTYRHAQARDRGALASNAGLTPACPCSICLFESSQCLLPYACAAGSHFSAASLAGTNHLPKFAGSRLFQFSPFSSVPHRHKAAFSDSRACPTGHSQFCVCYSKIPCLHVICLTNCTYSPPSAVTYPTPY